LFFSGHWCPPSRTFTPKLVDCYKSLYNELKHKFDIVFLSWDHDQESFDHYYQEMPWKALPYSGKSIFLLQSSFIFVLSKTP
jgi:nucleoredoxin